MSDRIDGMKGRRGFLKKLLGLVVAPKVVEAMPSAPVVPEVMNLKLRQEGASMMQREVIRELGQWMGRKKRHQLYAAMALGHEGPWTQEYHVDGSGVLKNGKGVEV